jgi:DNA-binding MarR family transcriptional regulator
LNREQELMSALAKATFRLHGQLVMIGGDLAQSAGMTGSCWQVLAAVLHTPLAVADVAREIGVTRQSVQRVADLLVEQGLAEYRPNPAHRRAKLLTPTQAGRDAIRRIAPAHAAFAGRLAGELGVAAMEDTLAAVKRLSEALEVLHDRRRAVPLNR